MMIFKFKGLLMNEGWMSPAYVKLDVNGKIQEISTTCLDKDKVLEDVDGYALPGFQNAHSHAFQYAMAGLTEDHPTDTTLNDFWSWREIMYSIACTISPDQLQDIATMLYTEMLRHGYTHVAEFHYLHHDQQGNHYAHLAEMGHRLVLAAKSAGINITLIPIFYQKGGFNIPPFSQQKRFISATSEAYIKLWETTHNMCKDYDHANLGIGFHSLRGVDPFEIRPTLTALNHDFPIHIHVAEQLQEVAQSVSTLGARPVEWLAENVGLAKNFHLVHATHINDREIKAIAASGARVVLCPSTEGNLGDGLFPLHQFQVVKGNWSIGTDSHIGLNPFEEIRLLDYGQRTKTHSRNTFEDNGLRRSGQTALRQFVTNGRLAMGNQNQQYFTIGEPLDALVLDANHPLSATTGNDRLLSTLLYTGDVSLNLGTIVNGKWVIQQQRHQRLNNTIDAFKRTINALKIRL